MIGSLLAVLVSLQLWQVTGQVVDASSGRPVAWADVFLEDTVDPDRSTAHQFTQADAAGHFVFRQVPPGRYHVVVSRPGWLGTERELAVDSSGTPRPMSVALVRSSVIAGTVADASGRPVAGLEVMAAPAEAATTDAPLIPRSGTTSVSDHLGRFRIHGLPPGRYLVGMSDKRREVDRFGFQWMPGTPFPDHAATVALDPGATADLALTIAPQPVAELTVLVVRDDDGTAAQSVLRLTRVGTTESNTLVPMRAALQGTGSNVFRIRVRSGLYQLQATSGALRNDTTVRVTTAEPMTITIRLKPRP